MVGVALLLLALSAVGFWHTGVTPLDYLQVWTRPHSIDFICGGCQSAAGDLADKCALSATASQLQTAAMDAVASAVSPYHYNYDNILLFPALLMGTSKNEEFQACSHLQKKRLTAPRGLLNCTSK